MQAGTVRWFNKTKGLGSITPIIGGNDIRVYALDISNHAFLQEGQRVQFTIDFSPNGFLARQVCVRAQKVLESLCPQEVLHFIFV